MYYCIPGQNFGSCILYFGGTKNVGGMKFHILVMLRKDNSHENNLLHSIS